MTKEHLLIYLQEDAKKYRLKALESIMRHRSMNELTADDIKKLLKHRELSQRAIDAILVDFINFIALAGDLGLSVRLLKEIPKITNITTEVMDATRKYARSKKGRKELKKILRKTAEDLGKLKEKRAVQKESKNQKITI